MNFFKKKSILSYKNKMSHFPPYYRTVVSGNVNKPGEEAYHLSQRLAGKREKRYGEPIDETERAREAAVALKLREEMKKAAEDQREQQRLAKEAEEAVAKAEAGAERARARAQEAAQYFQVGVQQKIDRDLFQGTGHGTYGFGGGKKRKSRRTKRKGSKCKGSRRGRRGSRTRRR